MENPFIVSSYQAFISSFSSILVSEIGDKVENKLYFSNFIDIFHSSYYGHEIQHVIFFVIDLV